jgi:hypothetical protein
LGWLKSNVVYELYDGVPDFDTPMGVLLMLVWRQRQAIEFQKQRSLIQALASQKEADDKVIKDVFDQMKEAFFPFDKNARKSELKKMEEVMKAWINRGPLAVTALEDPGRNRKMASKLFQGQRVLAARKTERETGKTVEIDPFQKAKQRRRTRGAS